MVLQKFGGFSANDPQTLQTIADKALVTPAIENDLLTAEGKVKDQLDTFVYKKLLPVEERRKSCSVLNNN